MTNVFGRMVGKERQGWAIFAVMGILFLAGTFTVYATESGGNPAFAVFPVDATPSALQAGGNMEGKEVRFGMVNSSLFTTITTDASCGAVNNMHDSLLPLAGMVPMINIMLGEIIFGGVGSGLYGMLLFAIVAVFVAGLMVGRTPEYLGKKIEAREVKMAILAILILPLSILGFTALAVVVTPGLAGMANSGPHGFSEALYAYTSATGNNGSAFAGSQRQHAFLQYDARPRDVDRPLSVHRSDARDSWIPGKQEDRASLGWNLPDRWRAFCRSSDRRDLDHRRPDLLSGPRSRTDRGTSRDVRRYPFLIAANELLGQTNER